MPAAATTFSVMDVIQTFTAPTTGSYDILAIGAGGGTSTLPNGPNSDVTHTGGLGAEVGGTFTLMAGEMLRIAVGAVGGDAFELGGGGGGGSFVVAPGNMPLVIAGGGGGASEFANGGNALGSATSGGNGGAAGSGTSGNGGGGGGLSGNGVTGSDATDGGGGFAFVNGAAGGAAYLAAGAGGFGGGGGGGDSGAGGGGGFTGGAGGPGETVSAFGLGGSSFAAGTNPLVMLDVEAADGSVTITPVSAAVPEPGSLALVATGLFGLLARRRYTGRAKSPSFLA